MNYRMLIGGIARKYSLYLFEGALFVASASALLVSPPAHAYNISAKGKVHERLTARSIECLKNEKADKCELPTTERELRDDKPAMGELEYATRWPDDPTDQSNLLAIGKLGFNAGFGHCKKLIGEGKQYAGQLCNSHFGSAQFMHAMRTAPEQDVETTVRLIAGWTRFAFGVATGDISTDANFCMEVRRKSGAFADAMVPADFPYCGQDAQGNYAQGGVDGVWSVGNFFTFSCRNPLSSQKCKVADAESAKRLAPIEATGALLHMIQDSYSRSHTGRGVVYSHGPYVPAIDCAPVDAFYDYNENKPSHAAADGFPTFDENCGAPGNPVLDPVTAGAQMLQLIGQHSDPERAVQLVVEKVLGRTL